MLLQWTETGGRGQSGGRALFLVAEEHVWDSAVVILLRRLLMVDIVLVQTDRLTTATRTIALVRRHCLLRLTYQFTSK